MPDIMSRGFDLKSLITQVGVIFGACVLVSVICGVFDVSPRRNAEITITVFCFATVLWWRRQVNMLPSAYLLAALMPVPFIVGYFVAKQDPGFLEAKRQSKPYELHSAAYFIRIERDAKDPKFIVESDRLLYGIRATRDISDTEQLFNEGIYTDHKLAEFHHWPGTEKELPQSSERREKFQVLFSLRSGDTRTVATGADFRIPYPFGTRDALHNQLKLAPTEDITVYHNGTAAICEVLILLESASFKLLRGAAGRDQTLSDALAKSEEGGNSTLSARWTNVRPKETLWIHYDLVPQQKQSAPGAKLGGVAYD